MNLSKFNSESLFTAATDLFAQLGIKLNSNTAESLSARELLGNEHFKDNDTFHAIVETYYIGTIDDSIFEATNLFDQKYSIDEAREQADRNYNGLMLFALSLSKAPTRTEISTLTRAFNRISQKMPVALLLKYELNGETTISLAISERFKFKQAWRQGEKAGKVIILRDISAENTHAGHQRILTDLVKPAGVSNYAQLHERWLEVLDVNILNKKFYQELASWYFWAMDVVEFPDDVEKDREVRNATNLIRLITRIIFIWFIKEKSLIPNSLFDKNYLKTIVRKFNEDEKSKNYYPAVLQNLFFATLNQKMEERKFAKDGGSQTINKAEYGVKTLFRYAHLFQISQNDVLQLYKDIPFLNGGLFDCLDNPKGENKYIDGFSRNPRRMPYVPDVLFFGEERNIDLNDIFATRNKRYKAKGLINLLESYKFTIAENTPLEEDVALDPELLGKVFENLLASYNPETKTTARKQTGSFYTPREIVSYMVDESLLEYLKQACSNKSADTETLLRELFAYENDENPFDETETRKLIEALNHCKILDPACGSGAFPMGILHRMVHILQKLDPGNELWKEQQREKIVGEQIRQLEKDKRAIEGLSDRQVREKAVEAVEERLEELEEIFNRNYNFDDYSRKLYLIENCIYGIDIQPIAVQIAKLRFFISLVIDQKANKEKDNFGIRSLPNLETKFVAANTLIGLEKPQQLVLRNPDIEAIENELRKLRHKYFNATRRKEKLEYQQQDTKLRKEIAALLESDGWDTKVAQQIAAFDPYDQNQSSEWFDMEWMFGVSGGVDLVIGNPPYGAELNEEEKRYLSIKFREQNSRNKNSAIFFIFIAHHLLKPNGINSYIVPKSLSYSQGWNACASFLLSELIGFHDTGKSFDNVLLEMVVFVKKKNSEHACYKTGSFNHETFINFGFLEKEIFKKYNVLLTSQSSLEIELLKKILYEATTVWGDYLSIERGLNWQSRARLNKGNIPIYRGAQLDKFCFDTPTDFINLNKFNNSEYEYQLRPKILNQLAIAHVKNPFPHFYLQAHLDLENNLVYETISCSFSKSKKIELNFLLGINNSKIFAWLLYKFVFNNAIRSTRYDEQYVAKIPCPEFLSINQKPVSFLVDQILSVKQSNPHTDTTSLENRIDELVFKLYDLTYDEVKVIAPDFWLSEAEYENLEMDA